MTLPQVHDELILGTDLDLFEQREVEVVAIDQEQQLYTVYDAKEDELLVLALDADGHFEQVKYTPEKEPWEL